MLYAGSALTGKVFQGLGKSSKFNIWASRYQVSEIVVIRIFQGSQRVLARAFMMRRGFWVTTNIVNIQEH